MILAEPGWRFTWLSDGEIRERRVIGWALRSDGAALPVVVQEDREWAGTEDPQECYQGEPLWPAVQLLAPGQARRP